MTQFYFSKEQQDRLDAMRESAEEKSMADYNETAYKAACTVRYWRDGGDSFYCQLLSLMRKADASNRIKLGAFYPDLMQALREWDQAPTEQDFFARYGMDLDRPLNDNFIKAINQVESYAPDLNFNISMQIGEWRKLLARREFLEKKYAQLRKVEAIAKKFMELRCIVTREVGLLAQELCDAFKEDEKE